MGSASCLILPLTPMHPDRILLVYNESDGLFDAVSGWTHKLLSPGTYHCALCRITFGLTGMLVPWKSYLDLLPFQKAFLHRDEFKAKYPALAATPLPVILAEKDDRWEILLSAEEIRTTASLSRLINLMQIRLENWEPCAPLPDHL